MSTTPSRILVPIDFSPASNRALSLANVPSTVAVVTGHVAQKISSHAQDNGYDLVVLAINGLSGLSHAVLGSVAERVVRLSTVPVLTVRRS